MTEMSRAHSYSSLRLLQKCEQAYMYRYYYGLERDGMPSLPALRGTAWHAVMFADNLCKGLAAGTLAHKPEAVQIVTGVSLPLDWSGDWPTIQLAGGPEKLTVASVLDAIGEWEEAQEANLREAIVEKYGDSLRARLLDLLLRYNARWGNDAYDVLAVEYQWERISPAQMRLRGVVDAVLWDREKSMVVVRDYKTHESWPTSPDSVADLMSSQLHLQAWGISEWTASLGYGKAKIVEYDRARFKKPATPTLTKSGALSKSVTDFDAHTYLAWCRANKTEPDQELTMRLALEKQDAFFRRSSKPVSSNSVAVHVLSSERTAERAELMLPERAALSPSDDCTYCEFLSACRTNVIGGMPDPFIPADFGLRIRKTS